MVYLVLGKVFISLWHNLYAFGQNFHCCTKWPNIENTIWSLWPQRTFAMQREEAIFSLLRRHSTLAIKRDGTFNDQRIFDRRSTNLQIHTFVRVRDFSNFDTSHSGKWRGGRQVIISSLLSSSERQLSLPEDVQLLLRLLLSHRQDLLRLAHRRGSSNPRVDII